MLFKVLLFVTVLMFVSAQEGYEDDEEQLENTHRSEPYNFGYSIKDEHGAQTRQETSDGNGRVTGSYSFVDERGIERIVQYIADHLGFRAKIITNEPGTAKQHPAGVIMESSQG